MSAEHESPPARALAGAAVLVLLLLLIAQIWVGRSLAHRLDSAGWQLHTMQGCPACVMQEALLGDSQTVPIFPCVQLTTEEGTEARTQERETVRSRGYTVCAENTEGYPMWYNAKTQEKRHGLQRRADLMQMAGY